jgi:hypothetical protein
VELDSFGQYFGYTNKLLGNSTDRNKTHEIDMRVADFYWKLRSSPVGAGMSTSSKSTKSKRSPQEDGPEEEVDDEMPTTTEEGTGRKTTKKPKTLTKDSTVTPFSVGNDEGKTFFQALSHRNFFQCTRTSAKLHAKQADTFLYYFVYNRNVSFLDYWRQNYLQNYGNNIILSRILKFYKIVFYPAENFFFFLSTDLFKTGKTVVINGPVHGDELQYLFDLDEMGDFPLIRPKFRAKSLSFSRSLVKIWLNFITTGKPEKSWSPLEKGGKTPLKWQQIGDKIESISEPWTGPLDFWDTLFNLEKTIVLPPLMEKNGTKEKRKGRGSTTPQPDSGERSGEDGETTLEPTGTILDLVYVDQQGDEDGRGGIFEEVDDAHRR